MNNVISSLGLSSVMSGTQGVAVYHEDSKNTIKSLSPIDGSLIGEVTITSAENYDRVVEDAKSAFMSWREYPAPKRGEIVRLIGEALRKNKDALGRLVSIETGKILTEGLGEIQEAIDIADYAVGLSRQLYGLSMHSERSKHRMYEQWHPLGAIGVITAFNFPAAVWAWNAMIAAVCGDTIVWKPSQETPVISVAMNKIASEIASQHGFPGVFGLVTDEASILGKKMAADRRLPLISATGSCAMGKAVGEVVAGRLGRSILELGGNNAIIVLDDAELDLVIPSVAFGAVGTAGQRCTSTRRLLVQKGVINEVVSRLVKAYEQVRIGDPLKENTLMGPLINERAVAQYKFAIEEIKKEGGEILYGGEVLTGMPSSLYVKPTIVRARKDMKMVKEETFAPILYVIPVNDLNEAIAINNDVPQGLSSSIFTAGLRNAETFLSCAGSDCGIANVNIGTSGAEIGGAFGGEKETGGGRESGSDSWKQYMRRQTNTINYSRELPLAQGIRFDL